MNVEPLSGEILEEAALDCKAFARACGVSMEWVSAQVEAGAILVAGSVREEWRFGARDLLRARHLAALERDFDAAPELAALVIDLQDEIARLRRLLG